MIYTESRRIKGIWPPLTRPAPRCGFPTPSGAPDDRLSAGFTEYTEASRLTWTFDYDEVFFMLEGYLEIEVEGQDPVRYEAGDLGFIEKGARTTISRAGTGLHAACHPPGVALRVK